MKRIFSSVLFFVAFFVYGQNVNDFTFTINENGVSITLTGYKGNERNLVIPEQINGIPVISIGWQWYVDSNISSVFIPKTITSISSSVFTQWFSLLEINVDEGNPVYYSSAGILFGKDNSIVRYPSQKRETSYVVPSGITKIGDNAFSHNHILLTVTLPSGLKEIGEYAFYGSNIESIIFPDSLEKIGMYTFYECSKLKIQSIPNQIKEIGYGAFYGCDSISTTIRERIESIGDSAFSAGV